MKPNRRFVVFIASFLLIFAVGITIQVVAQTIADLRATNTARLAVDNNNNGLADGGDVIEYTVNIANCSPNVISGMTYQSDIDPNTVLIPSSVQVTIQGTGLCGDTSAPPPPPPPPVNADAVDDAFTITNGATNTETILTNDTGEAPITVVTFGGPLVANVGDNPADGVTAYIAPSGIIYTLDSAGNLTIDASSLAIGSSGTDTLFYQIQAGNATTDTAQITITYGDFPTAVDDTYSVSPSGVLNDDLTSNDTLGTPAATVVSFGGGSLGGTSNTPNTITPLPGYPDGSLTVNTDGTFSFTAPATFTGTFTFDYTLDNGIGTSTATVTINVEVPPTVTSTTPLNSAVNVASNSDVIINFSELVDVAGDWVSLVCTTSGTFSPSNTNVTITPASPATSFTITPTGGFDPAGESCTVTLTATLITDNDTNPPGETPAQDQLDGDNNGTGGDNYVFSFTTTDAPPAVTTTTPLTGATVADNQPVTINFSELVSLSNVPGTGITWVCGVTPITYTTGATANITSVTLTPTITLPQDTTCTVTVNDVDVADDDLLDPPNTMTADYIFNFTVDGTITVTATTPLNGASDFPLTDDIVITFDEAPTPNGNWFSLVCLPSATTIDTSNSVITPSGNTLTINPNNPLPIGETCTVTILSSATNGITDADAFDAPDLLDGNNDGITGDNYVFSFTTSDTAPAVTTTTPLTGATVADNQPVTINFSELVSLSNVPGTGITWVCGITPITYTTGATANITSVTLTPTITLPQDTTCTVTVNDVDVADDDLIDPPNTMTADYIFNFTVDGTITVTATTPVDSTNNVALNSDVTITFDEIPQLNGGWFTIACTTSNITTANSLVNLVGNVATINPNTDFLTGETCTVTVLSSAANGVTDADAFDPPDLLDGNNDGLTGDNYTFTFITSDSLPELTLAEVEQGGFVNVAVTSTQIANNTDIRLTFDETVTFAGGAYSVVCATSGDVTASYTASATPASIVTLTYGGAGLADGEVCTVTLVSTQITDTDGLPPAQLDGDGDNIQDGSPADDEVFTFTVDNSPSVNSTNPADGAINVSLATNLVINFSEPVNFSGASTTLDCGAGAIAYTITGDGTATITLDPTPATLPVNAPCVLTIAASDVTDVDAGDPPNTMAANVVVNFTTVDDAPPTVLVTAPTNGATGVATDTDISITFSENVDINIAGFSLNCAGAIGFTPALPTTATPNITFTPSSILPANTLCTVTLLAVSITDQDGPADQLDGDNNGTGGDNYVFTFTTDGAPTVINTVPNNGATGVTSTANIVIDFNEAVVADETSFTIVCGATPITINVGDVTGSGTATITINPTDPFVDGATCTVTVLAAGITDVDAGDPPDNMVADYIFSFDTDAPPSVISTAPLDTATNINTTTNIVINFNENVDIAAGGIVVNCGFGPITYTPALPLLNTATININPDSDLPAGATCTVTVDDVGVTDVDTFDPPNTMVADYVFSFTTDAAPTLTGVQAELSNTLTPIVPPTVLADVDDDTSIVLTFSEPVNNLGGVTVTCTTGVPLTTNGSGLDTAGNGTATLTITRTAGTYNGGDTCTISFTPAQITDADVNDPPDELVPPVPATYQFTVRATANDDAYTVTPHLTYTSPTGVRANDNPNTATITGFGDTIGNANANATGSAVAITGGTVVLNADGTFIFYPIAGFSNTSTSFFYTIAGGDTAQVTINVQNREFVWFVNNNPTAPPAPFVCSAPYTGTQACPSADIATVAALDTPSDTIFVAQGVGSYDCQVQLETNERFLGDGSSGTLSLYAGITPVAGSSFPAFTGTDPVLTSTGNCLTLTNNHIIRGIQIDNTTGYAITSAVNIGNTTIAETSITGTGGIFNLTGGGIINGAFEVLSSSSHTGRVINLTNMTGAINNTGGTITNNANTDVIAVNGGTVSLTLFSTASKTGGTGNLLTVAGGHATGTLNFISGISHSSAAGSGVQFNNADGNYLVNGNLSITAGTAGVNIENGSAGTINFVSAGSSITGVNGISFRINNSTSNVSYAGTITHTAQANRGIEIIQGTGTINFTGILQIGTVGSPMLSAVGVFLDDTGNTNLISFADLNIITGTNGGAGSQAFVSQTTGRIAVTTGDINCDGNLGADNHCFDVSNTVSGGVTFATILSDHDDGGEAGGAIFLNNIAGAFTFQENLGMTGFNASIIQATNFGTLNIGTVATANVVTTNRPAVNINNGAINITAESVSMFGGAANGMLIQNTTGTFTVTGDGGGANNGSGGTIQNTTNDAVVLNNTAGLISLNYMIIQDIGDMGGGMNTLTGHNAIDGVNVNGGLSLNRTIIRRISDQAIFGGTFGSPDTPTVWNGLTITNSTIENTNRYHVAGIGDANSEGMIRILGIRGTVTITDSTLQDGAEMLDFFVTAGTLNLTVTNSAFNRSYKEFTSGVLASVGNHCIDVVVQGAGSANVVVGSRTVPALGNDFLNCRIGSIRMVNDTGATGNSTFIAGNNSFVSNDHSSGIGGDFDFPQGGVLAQTLGTGAMDVIIEDNYFDEITNASGGLGQLSLAIDNGTMQALVRDNTFDTPGNAPWWVVARGGDGTVQFVNNVVIQGFFACPDPSCEDFIPPAGGYNGPGLRTLFDAQNGSILNVTMDNNTLAEHDTGFDPGQTVEFRALNAGPAPTMCVTLLNNRAPDGYSLEQFAGTFNLDNGVNAFTGICTVGQCQTVLQSNGNTGGANNPLTTPPFVNLVGNINVANATCPIPTGGIFP